MLQNDNSGFFKGSSVQRLLQVACYRNSYYLVENLEAYGQSRRFYTTVDFHHLKATPISKSTAVFINLDLDLD